MHLRSFQILLAGFIDGGFQLFDRGCAGKHRDVFRRGLSDRHHDKTRCPGQTQRAGQFIISRNCGHLNALREWFFTQSCPGSLRNIIQRKRPFDIPDMVNTVAILDRLGRIAMDIRKTVEQLAASDIRVHCLALGGVDLTSPTGK